MAVKGYSVGSGSLGEPSWKRALESGGLKEGLEQDQLGGGEGALSIALQSVRVIVRFT